MPKIPSDIQKWNKRWSTDIKYCRPSSGGAVGIVYVWTQNLGWQSANGSYANYEPKDAAFVIKPIQGSAAPTKFAEGILSKIGGAQSPNSVPIKRSTIHAQSLVNMLFRFSNSETDATTKARWQAVFHHYQHADALLIQETQKGIQELGDFYKADEYAKQNGGLEKILTNETLMTNLGKLFAADALIGNGDRLSNMNTGNIAFDAQGQVLAIDSTTILTNFQTIVEDTTNLATGLMSNDTNNWVSAHIHKSDYNANPTIGQQRAFQPGVTSAPVLPPGAGISEIFDVKTWWTQKFRRELEAKLKQHCPTAASPDENTWFQAELWFTNGVNMGIQQIDMKLSGLNWLMIKNKYKSFVSKYGGDPNLDWMNFKVRRRYVKLRNKGFSDDQALTAIKQYVSQRMPGF